MFGYGKQSGAFVAYAEKAIIDSVYFNKPTYHEVNEAFQKALDNNLINIDRLKAYSIQMRSASLINKIGYLMESNGLIATDLLKYRSVRKIQLTQAGKMYDQKWRVIHD